jgi:hypothetical protein
LTLVVTNANNLRAESDIDERVIFGWIEWVAVEPSMIPAKAKLDTGAKTSSLHAKNIEWFEKDGKDWVRFQFSPNTKLSSKRMLEGKTKNFVTIEAPVYRSTLIKQHKRASAERPVILHKFMLDGREYEAEFTLTDRSRFIYPVLLGRRFLEKTAIVDPAHTYLRTQPPPPKKEAREKQTAPAASKDDRATSTDSPKPDEKQSTATAAGKSVTP